MTDWDYVENLINKLLWQLERKMRPGIEETPKRVAKMYRELLSGGDPEEHMKLFMSDGDAMVTMPNIEVYSLCEHHMLPFFGKAFIAMIPNTKVLGASKYARIVDCFARRLQIQERLTVEVANFLFHHEKLEPVGVMVVMECQHMCMKIRGVKSEGSMVTSAVRGAFKEKQKAREEALMFWQATR